MSIWYYDRPVCADLLSDKAKELVSSGNTIEPANRRPAPDAGSAALPAISSVTGELAAVGRRQLGPPEGGVTYATVLAGPIPRFSQVGRSSQQPWIRTRPNPLSHPGQPIGSCLSTCPGL